ncbi:MAG TPA: hypothetical protein VMZ06_07935 [Candidatus Bathyarchaeia archaeon]|nr:hypothetical protein [Candidatus Bathyarchaeia archaeon]
MFFCRQDRKVVAHGSFPGYFDGFDAYYFRILGFSIEAVFAHLAHAHLDDFADAGWSLPPSSNVLPWVWQPRNAGTSAT